MSRAIYRQAVAVVPWRLKDAETNRTAQWFEPCIGGGYFLSYCLRSEHETGFVRWTSMEPSGSSTIALGHYEAAGSSDGVRQPRSGFRHRRESA